MVPYVCLYVYTVATCSAKRQKESFKSYLHLFSFLNSDQRACSKKKKFSITGHNVVYDFRGDSLSHVCTDSYKRQHKRQTSSYSPFKIPFPRRFITVIFCLLQFLFPALSNVCLSDSYRGEFETSSRMSCV